MSILRVYDPAESDPQGVPLDWERCRWCPSDGMIHTDKPCKTSPYPCSRCDGHGSLKTAALRKLVEFGSCPIEDGGPCKRGSFCSALHLPRCEDCGHPMSEGTWENAPTAPYRGGQTMLDALYVLREGREPDMLATVHFSPCDEGCRHGGPGRAKDPLKGDGWSPVIDFGPFAGHYDCEASWRPVDVRCLGWPHDLRPEKLAVLCLRCWAAKTSS